VKLAPNDILYVPTNEKLKAGASLIGLITAATPDAVLSTR
jgi:hypothetical protein